MSVYDIAIIGGGPAGLSAALTARIHNKSVILFEAAGFSDKLRSTPRIDNYPGIATVSGSDFMDQLLAQALVYDPVVVKERVQSVFIGMPFIIMTNESIYEAKSVIIATGVAMSKTVPGERTLLGRGVSYCASCDGQFFKNKDIAVYINTLAYKQDVHLLGTLVRRMDLYIGSNRGLTDDWLLSLPSSVVVHKGVTINRVVGAEKVTAIESNEGIKYVDGVFFLRDSSPPEHIVDGLVLDGAFVAVGRNMETNYKGIFAAGDVSGLPLQIAKAVGEGQMAAFSAVAFSS